MDEKIKYIMESNEIRNKLCKMGICPVVGPTGPKGDRGDIGPVGETGISHEIIIDETKTINPDEPAKVQDEFNNNTHYLTFYIPKGEKGEQGSIGPKGEQGDTGPMGLPGEKGISEIIIIDKTETVEPDEPAKIQDDFDDNTHHLTFYIPKGEKGEKGDQGSVGPAGPTGSLGPTSYDVVAFVSYPNTTVAGIALTGCFKNNSRHYK